MSLVLVGLTVLLLLALVRRSFRLMLGLGGALATVAGLGGGDDSALAPRRSPAAEPRPWAVAPGTERLWVTAERLHRRTCPSTDCGSVGRLYFREAVTAREVRDGWVRITGRYDAQCRGGRSALVDSGTVDCSAANGIEGGRLAEWVSAEFLAPTRPPDPAATAAADEALVAGSDDFARYRRTFAAAAADLIADGRCGASDFRQTGGWMQSTGHPDAPVYFTYCGGTTAANRLYLNASTGAIFR
ncbi:MAG: hypothetical protein KDK12_17865 [Rhodobacteraceae bacterium]|nr:hypothetical protein [Paracoccaceae bacterium]